MAMTEGELQEARRPYAATANVVAVLRRTQTRNLPEVIDEDFYRLVDIPDVVFGRVREALRFLDMTGDDGRPTDRLRSLAGSEDEEFRTGLAAAIRDAYADDFGRIDPAQDTQPQIVSAFRRYQPRSQTARMVMLFLGLCREAGIPVLDAPRERTMRSSSRPSTTTRPKASGAAASRSKNGTAAPGRKPPAEPAAPGVLFGVTEADIGALDEDEFQEVWAALGKIARKRAQPKTSSAEQPAEADDAGGQI